MTRPQMMALESYSSSTPGEHPVNYVMITEIGYSYHCPSCRWEAKRGGKLPADHAPNQDEIWAQTIDAIRRLILHRFEHTNELWPDDINIAGADKAVGLAFAALKNSGIIKDGGERRSSRIVRMKHRQIHNWILVNKVSE